MPYLVRRVFSNRSPSGRAHENLLEIDFTKDNDYMIEVKGYSFKLGLGDLYVLTNSLQAELKRRQKEIIEL